MLSMSATKMPGMTISPSPSIEQGMGFTPSALGKRILTGALRPLATDTITSVPKTQKTSYTKSPHSKMTPLLKRGSIHGLVS